MAKHSLARFHGQPGAFEGQCEAGRMSDPTTRCRQHAIVGSNVCGTHGGRAPQVKQAARMRLAALVDPAIDVYQKILKPKSGKAVKIEVQRAAAKEILDLNGLRAKEEIIISHEFDTDQFSHMSDEEISQLVALTRKATVQRDVRGT